MSGNGNKHKGSSVSSSFADRVFYFFCLECRARRDSVDPGETFPVCQACGKRRLERRYESPPVENKPTLKLSDMPEDPRPENIDELAIVTKPKRIRSPRELALEVVTQLVTDLPAALDNPDTYHAMMHRVFPPFAREMVHIMVIERVSWGSAVALVRNERSYKEFCLRFSAQLEAFEKWASGPEHGVPGTSFLEPETNAPHDPLATRVSFDGRTGSPEQSGVP